MASVSAQLVVQAEINQTLNRRWYQPLLFSGVYSILCFVDVQDSCPDGFRPAVSSATTCQAGVRVDGTTMLFSSICYSGGQTGGQTAPALLPTFALDSEPRFAVMLGCAVMLCRTPLMMRSAQKASSWRAQHQRQHPNQQQQMQR